MPQGPQTQLPVVAVFARNPIAGQVKTRLAQSLGVTEALLVYQQLLRELLQQLAVAPSYELQLWLADGPPTPFIQQLARQYQLRVQIQQGADLGARMAHAVDVVTGAGRWVVVLGADVQGLSVEYLREVIRSLAAGADLVLSPVPDGGYGLLALKQPRPELFLDIDWGTNQVTAQTLARAAASALSVEQLPGLWDLDTPTDYQRWQQR